MVIAGMVLVPVTLAVMGFIVLKAVQLGLKWNVQLQKGEAPTVELPKIPNPLAMIQERKQGKEAASVLDEWLNGTKEGK